MKNNMTITLRPYKYLSPSEKTDSIMILSFLLPQFLLLLISRSWISVIMTVATVIASEIVEILTNLKKEKKVYNFFNAAITGMLIGLFLPSTFPVPAAFVISFVTLFVCRFFIGGYADCWINTSALTVCICWLLGAGLFPDYQISSEILLARNPALELINNGTFPVLPVDARITAALNKTVFSLFGVSIPEGYISLFWDTHALIPAFRFNFITLITSIVLISTDIIKPLIPGIFILVYGLLIHFLSPLYYGGSAGQGDLLLCLCTSGILLSSLFLLQHPGTTPLSTAGKVVYAAVAGILGFFIIGAGTSPSGAVFTVLCINVISTVIQNIEHIAEIKYTKDVLMDKVKEFKEGKDA